MAAHPSLGITMLMVGKPGEAAGGKPRLEKAPAEPVQVVVMLLATVALCHGTHGGSTKVEGTSETSFTKIAGPRPHNICLYAAEAVCHGH